MTARATGPVVFAALLSLAGAATTVSVDFNTTAAQFQTYSGEAAAPASGGTTWNGFTTGPSGGATVTTITSSPLVTSTGSPTPITVTLGNFKSYVAGSAAGVAPNLMTNFVYQPTLGPSGPNATFSINNLDPSSTYDLYLYSQNASFQNTATIFTINGVSLTATNAGGSPVPLTTTFIEGTNYVKFSGLVPGLTGVISGTFNDVPVANNAAFNGFQLVQVPEPSTLTLGGGHNCRPAAPPPALREPAAGGV